MHPLEFWHLNLVLRSRPDSPAHDVILTREECPERRLDIGIPDLFAANSTPKRATDEPGEGHTKREVQPDQKVRTLREKRFCKRILPLCNPCARVNEPGYLVEELVPRRPHRTPPQRIDLDMNSSHNEGNSSGERGLSGSGYASNENTPRSASKRIGVSKHGPSIGVVLRLPPTSLVALQVQCNRALSTHQYARECGPIR